MGKVVYDVLSKTFDLFEAIGSTSSRTEKAKLLKQGSENELFINLLKITYDPSLTFNVKQKPRVKPTGTEETVEKYIQFNNLLVDLYHRAITGNDAKDAVKAFFQSCTEREMEWYWGVMRKDLKIGIKSASINDVFPDLIPEYSCMLAHPLKKLPNRFVYQAKLDGYRCNAFHYPNGSVELKSRNGHILEGFTGIEKDIEKLPVGYMYDGEIMATDFNGTQSVAFKKEEDKDGILHIFDMVSINEFEAGKGVTKYIQRLNKLEKQREIIDELDNVAILDYSGLLTPDREEELYEAHSDNVARGFEGTMVKDLDAVYECKKGYAIQKIKPFDSMDLKIIGVEEGKEGGKNVGKLGALIVDYNGEAVGVGSGFSDEQREDLWKRRNEIINCTVEVEFRGATKNKRGTSSLRHGVFKRFRPDKD